VADAALMAGRSSSEAGMNFCPNIQVARYIKSDWEIQRNPVGSGHFAATVITTSHT
jgi:hypothetical protein